MSRKRILVFVGAGLLTAGAALGHDDRRSGDGNAARAAPGVIERSLTRLERAMERLEARVTGRGGSAMDGCADMMGGGGMMGGSEPNALWRPSPRR